MATLQNIRNQSVLLLAVIGIAMLAFILGDLLKSTNSTGGNGIIVGEVLGEDVLVQIFQQKVDDGIENWKNQNQQAVLNQTTIAQIRDQIWNQHVRDLVMENEYQELGVSVSDDEFFELLQGVNVHPEISKVPSFQDPVTGVFDRARVLGYLKQIDQDETGDARKRWVGFQKYLIGLIKTKKYNSLVSLGMYITNEEAKIEFNSTNNNVTFDYVSIPFTSIAASDVEPTDNELATYYSNHKLEYLQEASKDVDFVVYTVVPSEEDDVKTKEEIRQLIADFEVYDDYELMARRNSDNRNARFIYTTKNELQDPIWNDLSNSSKGTVFGPYLASNGVYRIAKLAEIEYRPDSVEARHILMNPNQTMSLDSVNKRIEELKLAVELGADFAVLAKENSEDQGTAIKGGDLGWFKEGVMVEEFNEACFTAKRGDLVVVRSQFGVHLIQVTRTSKLVEKVKIAYIDRNVEPSTETFNLYYSQAAHFLSRVVNDGVPFDTLIVRDNLLKRSDKNVTANKQNIMGLPNSREMVRWMYTAEAGDVSEVFEFDNLYVVASLKKEHVEGTSPLEDVKEQIASLVINEKKGLKISNSIKNSDLATIAAAHGVMPIKDAKATFSNLNIQGIGYEPELVGGIFSNEEGVVSKPIIGRNAVYVIQVKTIDKSENNGDFMLQKLNMRKQAISYVSSASYNVLKEAANVKDNRVDFY